MAKEFDKVKALDELLILFKGAEIKSFSETIKMMQTAQDYLEIIHLESFQKGLEAGLKKIDIDYDHN